MTTGRCTCIMNTIYIVNFVNTCIHIQIHDFAHSCESYKNSTEKCLSMFSCFQLCFPNTIIKSTYLLCFCNVLLVLICVVCFMVVSCTLRFIMNFPTYAPEFIYFRHYSYYINFEVIALSCRRRIGFAKFKRTTIDVPLRTVILFVIWFIDLVY